LGGCFSAVLRSDLAVAFQGVPRPLLLLAFAVAGGVLLSLVMVALLMVSAPRRVSAASAERIAAALQSNIIGMAPLVAARDLRQLAPDLRNPAGLSVGVPQSVFAQAVRTMAGRMLRWRAGEAGIVVAIIAAAPREGASSLALAIARAAALAGKRVVVVDADVRERTLSVALSLTEGPGLWTALSGNGVDFAQMAQLQPHLVQDAYSDLVILPQADGASSTRELYSHPRLPGLIAALKDHFDLVLLDCAPVGLVEGRMTAAQADAIVLVSRWNATLLRHLAIARRGLERLGGVLPGVIINAAEEAAVRRWLGEPELGVRHDG